jgi:3-methyladenine DNA glycosylase Tag
MTPFEEIFETAIAIRGAQEIESRLPLSKSDQDLCAMVDAEYLSLMSRRIFRAGLKHSMVDAKWPAFEQVFFDFDIDQVRTMSDDALDALMKDRRIIRHWGKIKSVRANAQNIFDISQETDSFGSFLADWPNDAIVELWLELILRFMQLGGNSGPYFLRMAGKDTFLLTRDVIRALNRWGAFEGDPKSQKAKREVQDCFNIWKAESGKPLCQISIILALSIQ